MTIIVNPHTQGSSDFAHLTRLTKNNWIISEQEIDGYFLSHLGMWLTIVRCVFIERRLCQLIVSIG